MTENLATKEFNIQMTGLVITIMISLTILSCNNSTSSSSEKSRAPQKNSSKMNNKSTSSQQEKDSLLESLNYWVQQGGDPEHPIEGMKSSGEANSRFQEIKTLLQKDKVKIKWEKSSYVKSK